MYSQWTRFGNGYLLCAGWGISVGLIVNVVDITIKMLYVTCMLSD